MCDNVCIEVNETVENISIEVRDFSVLNIISQDAGNSATTGTDGLVFVPSGGGGVSNHSELNLDDGTNPHGTTKADVGLGNVDNTSDVDKPISIATQNALDNKQDNLTEVNFGTFSDSLTEKTNIVDADKFNVTDSADSNKQKKFTFANLKIVLTTFFNGLFAKVNLDSTTITGGTGVSINGGDNTKFDINVIGKIVNPTTFVSTPISVNLTAQTVTYLASQTESYIWIDENGIVIQSLTAPTPDLFDTILGYWVLVHSNLTNLNVVNDFAMFTDGLGTQFLQSLSFDGFRKKQNTNIVSPGTSGTRLSHSGGEVIKVGGGGFLTKRPIFSLNSAIDSTFRMRNRDDSEGADTQSMGVNSIDIGGVTTTLANNKFGAHKVWKFSSSLIRVQRGQYEYHNIESALIGIDVDAFVDSPNGSRNGIHIGWVIFKKGTTWDVGTPGVDYKFVDVVGGKSSGGGFIPTLQSVFNISPDPEILLPSGKDFSLQGGSGNDNDKIFSGKNNAGTETSWIKADGSSSFGGSSAEDIYKFFKGDYYVSQATGATLTNLGGANPSLVGTGANLTANFTSNYTTSPAGTWNSRRQASAASAGSSAEVYRSENKICSVGLGFYRSGKISTLTTSNSRSFHGLNDSLSATGNVNPSTLLNLIGFGRDTGDANLQIIHNDNTGVATKVDLGSDFAISSVNAFLYEIWNFKGSNTCYFRVKNLLNDITSSTIEVTTDLPTINDGLTMHDWINNGIDASAVTLYYTNITTLRQS